MSRSAGLGVLGGMSLLLRFVRLLPLAAVAAVPVIGSAACNAQLATVLSSDASADSSGGGDGGGGASCNSDQECNDDPAISALLGKCSPHSDESRGICTCNPGVPTTPSGKCGAATGDGGPNPDDCVAKGGLCLGKSTPPQNYRPAGKGEGTCAGTAACWVPVGTAPVPVCFNDQQCNGDPSVSALWGKCFYGVCMCNAGYTVQPSGKCHTPPPPECATQKGTCRQMPAECLADELGSGPETEMSCGDLIAAMGDTDRALVIDMPRAGERLLEGDRLPVQQAHQDGGIPASLLGPAFEMIELR